LPRQPSSITVYDLPTKENKLTVSVSVRSNQKFAVSVFCLQKTREVAIFHLRNSRNVEIRTWRHGNGNTDIETWNMEKWRHGDIKQKMGNGSLDNFP
jgi:hypothetical protein